MLPQNTNQMQMNVNDYDISGKGSMDAMGKGVNVPSPLEGMYQQNASSYQRYVGGGAVPMQAGSPMGTEDEQTEEDADSEESMAETEDSLKEHLAALFANTNLSEDFVEKAKTIFVAAINDKLNERSQRINEHYQISYSSALENTVNQLAEKVDDYLTYVVEEWVNENKLQVERGVKVEIAENFIFGLKKLFETNFIDVPDQKYDVLDELYSKIDEQHEHLNSTINENINLRKKLLDTGAVAVFAQETAGLAATQIDKLAELTEGVEYDNLDEFRRKLKTIKESFFATRAQAPRPQIKALPRMQKPIDILETSSVPETLTESTVNVYANAISRHLKHK